MTITRDIVRDLLPAYWSGDATADTRAAVEAFFAQDPAFAAEARREAQSLEPLGAAPSGEPDAATRLTTLRRAKRVLRAQRIMFALASTLTLNALSLGFSFEIAGRAVRVHWLAFPGQRWVVGCLALAAVATWALYGRLSRKVKTSVIG